MIETLNRLHTTYVTNISSIATTKHNDRIVKILLSLYFIFTLSMYTNILQSTILFAVNIYYNIAYVGLNMHILLKHIVYSVMSLL